MPLSEVVVGWITANWFQGLQAIGIVGGLLFTGISFRQNIRVHRAQTLISITQQHRSLWLKIFDRPDLKNVMRPTPRRGVIPFEEKLFVNMLILHITTILTAVREGVIDQPDGADADLKDFFSLPTPRKVWQESRQFHDKDTVSYLDALIDVHASGGDPTKQSKPSR